MPSSYMWQVPTPDVLACERRRIFGRQRGDDQKYVCVCRLMCLSSFCFRLHQIIKRCRYVLTENTRVGEVQHWKRLPTNQTTGKRYVDDKLKTRRVDVTSTFHSQMWPKAKFDKKSQSSFVKFWKTSSTKFSYPWCSAGALRARELRYQ